MLKAGCRPIESTRGGLANIQGGTIVLGVAEKSTGLSWVSSNLLRRMLAA